MQKEKNLSGSSLESENTQTTQNESVHNAQDENVQDEVVSDESDENESKDENIQNIKNEEQSKKEPIAYTDKSEFEAHFEKIKNDNIFGGEFEERSLSVENQNQSKLRIFLIGISNLFSPDFVFNKENLKLKNLFNGKSLNKNPILIGSFIAFLFLCFMLYGALQSAERSNSKSVANKKQSVETGSSVFADNLIKNRSGGIVSDSRRREAIPPAPDMVVVNTVQKDEGYTKQVAPVGQQFQIEKPLTDLEQEEKEHLRELRLMRWSNYLNAKAAGIKMAMNTDMALRNKNNVANNGANNINKHQNLELEALNNYHQNESRERFDANTAFMNGMERLQKLKSAEFINDLGNGDRIVNKNGMNGMNGNSMLANANVQNDRWFLDSTMQNPRTYYELRAGAVIPALLMTGINSELSGQILGQVSQNVYDTATGNHLLIPQGSRLVGVYSSEVAYGQSRVLVVWQRIIFPDGKAFDVGSMSGADSAGYAGFNDKVDNHYVRLFASAFLMSAITAGVSYSQSNLNNNSNNQRASDALSEALGQQLGNVTTQMIQKNLSISPTLTIREGFRFNVVVSKDLTFSKPYESFDY